MLPGRQFSGATPVLKTVAVGNSSSDCLFLHNLMGSLSGVFANPLCFGTALNCCACTEVTCRQTDGRVIGLSSYTPTRGSIPSALFQQLEALETLRLIDPTLLNPSDTSDDGIFKSSVLDYLPSSLISGSLPEGPFPANLSVLVLGGGFTGIVPDSWWLSQVPQLTRLQVISELTGTVAGSFKDIAPQLQVLQLVTSLSGQLLSSLFDGLPALQKMSIQGQFLGALPPLAGVAGSRMIWLDLEGQFTSNFPQDFSFLPSLQILSIVGNFFDVLQPSMGILPDLQVLIFFGQFSGMVPTSLLSNHSLYNLALVGRFEGTLPAAIGQLTSLQLLILAGNWNQPVPSYIPLLSQVELLVVVGQFTGALPSMAPMTKLSSLTVSGSFQGTNISMANFPTGPGVEVVIAEGLFQFVGPLNISVWPSMSNVQLSTKLSLSFKMDYDIAVLQAQPPMYFRICCGGPIQPEVVAALAETVQNGLDVSDMTIAGHLLFIEEVVGEILLLDRTGLTDLRIDFSAALQMISATGNYLSNMDFLTRTPYVQLLDLSDNNFGGALPILSIVGGFFTALSYVDISINNLTSLGWIAYSPLADMIYLNASTNLISDSLSPLLPIILGNVRTLDLGSNNFTGIVPAEFSSFTGLAELNIQGSSMLRLSPGPVFQMPAFIFVDLNSVHVSPSGPAFVCPDLYINSIDNSRIRLLINDRASDYQDCACETGYFGVPPDCELCTSVSSTASCPGKGPIYAPIGYWLSPPLDLERGVYPITMIACQDVGSGNSVCETSTSTGDVCTTGHGGRVCASCLSGYFFVGKRCFACVEDSIGLLFLAIFVAAILLVLSVYGLFYDREFSGNPILRILTELIQNLSVIAGPFVELTHGGSAVTSATLLSFGGFTCYFDQWDYKKQVLSPIALALVMMGVLFVFFCVMSVRYGIRRLVGRFVRHALWLYQLAFMGISVTLMSTWLWVYDPGLHARYFEQIPSVAYDSSFSSLCVGMFVLLIAIPVTGYGICLWRLSNTPRLRGSDHVIMSAIHEFGTSNYRPGLPWFDVWFLSRRILFSIGYVFIPPTSVYQQGFLWFLLGSSLAVDVLLQPYRRNVLNEIQTCGWLLLMLNLGTAGQFRVPNTTNQSSLSYLMLAVDLLAVVGLFLYWFLDRRRQIRVSQTKESSDNHWNDSFGSGGDYSTLGSSSTPYSISRSGANDGRGREGRGGGGGIGGGSFNMWTQPSEPNTLREMLIVRSSDL